MFNPYITRPNLKPLLSYCGSLLLLATFASSADDATTESIDAHIRRVVSALLKERDDKIQQLEARNRQLEHQLKTADAPPSKAGLDSHIRRLVAALLVEKEQKIQRLEANNRQLTHLVNSSPPTLTAAPAVEETSSAAIANSPKKSGISIVRKLGKLGGEIAKLKQTAPNQTINSAEFFPDNPQNAPSLLRRLTLLTQGVGQLKLAAVEQGAAHELAHTDANASATPTNESNSFSSKLSDLGTQLAELKQTVAKKGLLIGGFMDVVAKTDNSTDQNFNVGSVELDLQYNYNSHFALSTALISSAIAGTRAGNIGAGYTGIAVGLVDFHLFDDRIPPRGRLFNGQSFHLQAGRFDLPFSTDYQNFANTDRVTISAPITTTRMQFGGFNSDGFRSYGSWKHLNYSAFWTDNVYAPDGNSVGGRLGLNFGQNTYRTHNVSPEGFEIGISHLSDLDGQRNLRRALFGADFSFSYSFLKLQSEFMWLKAQRSFIASNGIDYGRPNELGYHATLIADLEQFVHQPITAVARYGRWQPDTAYMQDSNYDGSLVAINDVSALTFALRYTYNDHLKFKLEYTDSLGTQTQEKYFDKRLGMAQMIVGF